MFMTIIYTNYNTSGYATASIHSGTISIDHHNDDCIAKKSFGPVIAWSVKVIRWEMIRQQIAYLHEEFLYV